MNSEFTDPMDASLLQLERELRSLTPAPPGRDLLRSLQAHMGPGVPASQVNKVHTFPWRRMVTPAAAAAAAVAVMSIHNNRRVTAATGEKSNAAGQANTAAAIKWEPMPMRSEYRALLDAGYVLNENYEPVQQFLMNRLDHHEWRNPASNASVRLTIPSQQRFLVPAGYDGDLSSGSKRRLQFQ